MKILKKIFSPFGRDTNFIKILNYIVTSDYNESYLKEDKAKRINLFKWIYLIFILFALSMSFIPLVAGEIVTSNHTAFLWINIIMFCIFVTDYFLRWITYSFRANKKSKYPLLFFPFTGVSLIMIFAILPSFLALFSSYLSSLIDGDVINEIIKIFSSLVILQLGRFLLLLNVVPPFRIFTNIFEKQRKILIYVFLFLILVTLLFSIVIYRAEVDEVVNGVESKIHNYWDAFYFTVISICTIGYGDITPITDMGRAMVIVLAFVGVGIFTIPGAVIGAGFLDEIQTAKEEAKEKAARDLENGSYNDDKGISFIEKTLAKSATKVSSSVGKVKGTVKKTKTINKSKKQENKKSKDDQNIKKEKSYSASKKDIKK